MFSSPTSIKGRVFCRIFFLKNRLIYFSDEDWNLLIISGNVDLYHYLCTDCFLIPDPLSYEYLYKTILRVKTEMENIYSGPSAIKVRWAYFWSQSLFPLYGPFMKVRLKWKVSSTNFYGPWARYWVSVQSIRTFLGNLLSIKKKIDQINFFFWVHLSYLLSSRSITVMKYI